MKKFLYAAVPVAVVAICAALAYFVDWNPEDHRVRYDKEGRMMPFWCLKYLARAMHDYHEKHGHLPAAATYSNDGVPLLSWRVLVLPYLEQEDLFKQFKLDEPWDSPHNMKLLPKMPYTFAPITEVPPLEPGLTRFQVFVGNGTAFEGKTGMRLGLDIPRASYTVLIAESAHPVPWTKPEDMTFDEGDPTPKLGGIFRGFFHVTMADCTAFPLRDGAKDAILREAIKRDNKCTELPWN